MRTANTIRNVSSRNPNRDSARVLSSRMRVGADLNSESIGAGYGDRAARQSQQTRETQPLGSGGKLAYLGEVSLATLANIEKTFGKRTIFDQLNLNVEIGERLGFIGSNGSGKSTLFKVLM